MQSHMCSLETIFFKELKMDVMVLTKLLLTWKMALTGVSNPTARQ